MRRILWPRGKPETRRLLMLTACGMLLTGCAVKPPPPAVSCPEPVPVPAQLKESSLPEVRSWSDDAQRFLSEARDWLKGLR